MRTNTRMLILAALFSALTAIGAFLKFPLGAMSVTLQFLFTAMAGVLLGARWGALSQAAYVVLGLAYVCIIGALYVDFSKIRKVRRAYQEEMMSKKTKEMRAAEKQQKAAQRAAKQKVEEAPAVEEAPKKRGLFGNGFRLPKKQEAEPMEAKTSDKDSTK